MAEGSARSHPPASQECPARPLRVDAEVVENRAEGGANRRLVLRVDGWPGFGPGQFVMLSPGARAGVGRSDPLLPRPMAVFRTRPRDGAADVEVLLKVVGRGTALLAGTLPGQRVGLVGPLGRAFPELESGAEVVLVGGGSGIASIYELAARGAGRASVRVLLGARTGQELMGVADFAELGVTLRTATEDGSEGTRGLVTSLLEAALDEGRADRVYACGPAPMMRRAAELAAARGLPCVVSLENNMACGFGVCLGCAVPLREGGFALVCRDGPMFDAAAISWDGPA